jgi:hypothetical protein
VNTFIQPISQFRSLCPIHPTKNAEAVVDRGWAVKVKVENVLTPAAVQVHAARHARLIQRGGYITQRAVDSAHAERLSKVIVGMDDAESRFFQPSRSGEKF